jgi:uncharacterized RDD family membrane protein YckC
MAAPTPSFNESVDDHDSGLMTGEAVALDVRSTSFILCAAGAAIDWLVSAASLVILVLIIVKVGGSGIDQALATALVTLSLVFSIVVVPIGIELATRGRSLGRLAVGARIVRNDGGAIQFRHSFVRALMGVVEIFLTFGALAALTGLLNEKSRRLGDLLAGTYSQFERVPEITSSAFAVPVELRSWAEVADVAKLPDRLSRRIAQYLKQASGLTSIARASLAAELAQEASAFVSPLPRVDPELFLAGVAAVRRERDFAALTLERERLDRLAPLLDGLPHGFPDR